MNITSTYPRLALVLLAASSTAAWTGCGLSQTPDDRGGGGGGVRGGTGGSAAGGSGSGGAGAGGAAAGALVWDGVYDASGTWDLSGPITAQHTLGDAVADLLVDQIVSRAGVPSLVADQARRAVSALVADKISDLVDARTPAILKPDSDLMRRLAAVLASTEVSSTIDLYVGPTASAVRGSEEIRSFTFSAAGRKTTLPVGTLLERTVPLVTLGADWRGQASSAGVLTIEQHEFALRFGKMILWILDNVLEESGAASLSETAASIVDCDAITTLVLNGGTSFSFGVGIASYSVSGAALRAGCDEVVSMVRGKVLGQFDVDAGVAVGGEVQATDRDGDALADLLRSRPGYGGVVTKGPAAVAPRVAAPFEATRRPGPRHPGGFGPIYADMSNTLGTTLRLPVRGRVFMVASGFEPATATPFNQLSQQELANEPVTVAVEGSATVALGTVQTDAEGYLDQTIDVASLALPSGNHVLRFTVRGQLAGRASARLLAPVGPALVVRSDVDLTYLDTDFMSTTGKLALLVQRGAERTTLPAMEVAYRGLRRGQSSVEDVPLTFLSGSPGFFKMVLEDKMRRDLVLQDGVVLKPFKDIIAAKVADVDLAGVVPALEEQVGYKLTALLRLRLDVPADTQEILMGDDSEADAVAYTLYQRFTSRQLTTEALMTALDGVQVDATWKQTIAGLAPRVAAALPANSPVVAIYINATGKPNARFPVASWTVPQLTRYHDGAWPLALDLYEEGRASAATVAAVRARLLERGRTSANLTAAAQAAVTAGFVRPETVAAFP